MPRFIQQLADTATQMGQQALGGLMGMVFQKGQDRRQLKQAGKLQALEIAGQKEMTEYNYGKQMQMWKDTNYSAQMAELEKAGLNPGLIYGMGGGGGQSTNVATGNVSGQHAPTGGGEAIAMANTAAQLGLMRAQKENIEADTVKKKVEATKTAGVDTKEAETRILSLGQGIENARAQQKLTEVQTRIGEVAARVTEATEDSQGEMIRQELSKLESEARTALVDANVSEDTKADKISMVKAQLLGQWAQNALTKMQTAKGASDIRVNEQQITTMVMKVAQDWRALEIQGIHANTEKARQSADQYAQEFSQTTGLPLEVVKSVVQAIFLKGLISPGGKEPIRGFHNR